VSNPAPVPQTDGGPAEGERGPATRGAPQRDQAPLGGFRSTRARTGGLSARPVSAADTLNDARVVRLAEESGTRLRHPTGGGAALRGEAIEISSAEQAEAALGGVLAYLGLDLTADGLAETPGRMLRALGEMTEGYSVDTQGVLATTFAESAYDDLVTVAGVPFVSLCEHHVLPFEGVVTVGYVPSNGVVGLSKVARLVRALAARFQIQESLTRQIVTELDDALAPIAVGAVVTGRHSCMKCRGVRSDGAMQTHCFIRVTPVQRAEILDSHMRHASGTA
jgi:GTP cyclohydrolase IA